MPTPILATKLYIPPPRAKAVLRSRLVERLNDGLQRKLTLISAPAGFGKTTLVSAWVNANAEYGAQRAPRSAESASTPPSVLRTPYLVAWLSLDEGDDDLIRFLTHLVAALQAIAANFGQGVLGVLQSPQPPREPSEREAILTRWR